MALSKNWDSDLQPSLYLLLKMGLENIRLHLQVLLNTYLMHQKEKKPYLVVGLGSSLFDNKLILNSSDFDFHM